ncbi:MAG: PEP-CTERM sorting domain-containing protein [Bryobacteraceae bacterium]|jgi:PEP-CTERM motif
MKQVLRGFGAPSKTAIIGAFLLSANFGWGITASCTDTPPNTLSAFGTGNNAGCYETDKTFTNFAVVDNGSTVNPQSTSTLAILGSDNFTGVGSPWTVNAVFTGVGGNPLDLTGHGPPDLLTAGTLSMLVNSTNTFLTNPSYPTPAPGDTNFITTVSLSTFGATGNSGFDPDTISVTETVCVGVNVTCTAANEVTLTATYGNNTSAPTYGCVAGVSSNAVCGLATSSSPIIATYVAPVTTVTVYDAYALDVGSNTTTTVQLNNFTNSFGEGEFSTVPEPSTLLLFGTAFAAIAAFRFREGGQHS